MRCMQLRLFGMSYAEITRTIYGEEKAAAVKAGLPEDSVHQISISAVSIALKRILSRELAKAPETAIELREVELRRLDAMHAVAWAMSVNPDFEPGLRLAASDRVVKISAERRKMFGLDAPEKKSLVDANGETIESFTIRLVDPNATEKK
jgi:hypothetical protein